MEYEVSATSRVYDLVYEVLQEGVAFSAVQEASEKAFLDWQERRRAAAEERRSRRQEGNK